MSNHQLYSWLVAEDIRKKKKTINGECATDVKRDNYAEENGRKGEEVGHTCQEKY